MQRARSILRLTLFFLLGAAVTAAVLCAAAYLVFTAAFRQRIYPGVKVAGVDLSRLELETAQQVLSGKYATPSADLKFNFYSAQASFSATGRELDLKPDTKLMADRAFSVGRQTTNPYYNFLQIIAAWQGTINLPLELGLDNSILDQKIDAVAPLVERKPIDAVYQFVPGAGPDRRGRVTAFMPSEDGVEISREKIRQEIFDRAKRASKEKEWRIALPTSLIAPSVKSSTADDLGIKNLLGRGESYFYDSIPGRVYNIGLGTSKVSGSLVAPGETFSFNTAIGTVSAVFGFAKAYSIKEGKTILDDGGGVCQVSTTLYRAVINAGLPVVARTAHTYRVGFYEQGGFLPGLDATVYPPNPDLKFRNDTGGWILIQTNFDRTNQKLTFDLFGTSDGRRTTISGPVIVSTSPPPEPIYEDDPTKPVGEVTQVDTAHYGAEVYFVRKVVRNNQTIINETVKSSYVPWPARYLRGTRTN